MCKYHLSGKNPGLKCASTVQHEVTNTAIHIVEGSMEVSTTSSAGCPISISKGTTPMEASSPAQFQRLQKAVIVVVATDEDS